PGGQSRPTTRPGRPQCPVVSCPSADSSARECNGSPWPLVLQSWPEPRVQKDRCCAPIHRERLSRARAGRVTFGLTILTSTTPDQHDSTPRAPPSVHPAASVRHWYSGHLDRVLARRPVVIAP